MRQSTRGAQWDFLGLRASLPASAICLLLCCPLLRADNRNAGELHVQDLTLKFLKFYAAAALPSVTAPQRWELWRKEYGIAAVPPTPAGLALAHRQLDEVWSRCGRLLPAINARERAAERDAREMLPRVKTLLGAKAMRQPW